MRVMFVVNSMGMMDPAAIAFLSGVARDMGHERYLCVLQRDNFSRMVQNIKPDVLAYSLTSCDVRDVFKAHSEVGKLSGAFSIMGGPHPTLYPDSLRQSGADAYCIGEGEGAFEDVLWALEAGKPVDGIPNIYTLKSRTSPRPLCDLESLPIPDRDLTLSDPFLSAFPRKTFLTSRGCPYSCSYCFNSALRHISTGKWIRRFPVERVLAEIQDVRSKHNLRFVKFDDDNFAVRPDAWLDEFCERYRIEISLPFNCLLRLESASESMLTLLRRAGCHSITTSVDSANGRIRDDILQRQSGSNDALVEGMRRIHEHGIKLFVNFITAVPTATQEDELATMDMSRKGKIVYANYTALVPFEGTPVWQYCKDNRLLSGDTEVPESLMAPSALTCFTDSERRVQRNVLLLGAFSRYVPLPILRFVIQHVPPNRFFGVLYSLLKSKLVGDEVYANKSGFTDKLRVTVKSLRKDMKELWGN